ncbi:MAG: acyl-ACP--UDP-N-acetylglucosamine O-acyltransferase [Planctomycetaceae bacterium]|nr:acyl-ACP--UDP-N-acetylglucosamine O-acyltransferase [Planctomycetaceae bacterium]
MTSRISHLAVIDPRARLAPDVMVGPFCVVGPQVTLGAGCRLDSHVSLTGHCTIGERNRFWPGCVIGGEPQDKSYHDGATRVEIGNGNQFREGVTVNRGADKEDGCTRIGNNNLLMANSHVAHNCHVFNDTILVNGVLLGGHVHVQDRAIVSGNTVVHHFSTIGTLAFVSGGCRVPHDIPPFMLAAGSDNPEIRTVNLVGMRRAGMSDDAIRLIKQAYRLLYREHKALDAVRAQFCAELDGRLPIELMTLLNFVETQRRGKMGRGREAVRMKDAHQPVSEAA